MGLSNESFASISIFVPSGCSVLLTEDIKSTWIKLPICQNSLIKLYTKSTLLHCGKETYNLTGTMTDYIGR